MITLNYEQVVQLKDAVRYASTNELRQTMLGAVVYDNMMYCTNAHIMYQEKTSIRGNWFFPTSDVKKLKCKRDQTIDMPIEPLLRDTAQPYRIVADAEGKESRNNYPDHKAVIPKMVETVTIPAHEIDNLRHFCKIGAIVDEEKCLLKLEIKSEEVPGKDDIKGIIRLTTNVQSMFKGTLCYGVKILAKEEPTPFTCGVNAAYMGIILKNVKGDITFQHTNTSTRAMLVDNKLIMPIILDDEGQ